MEAIALQRLSDSLRLAMADHPYATFSEVIEALSLLASENAANCVPGSVNQTSWDNASARLFDLSQASRLYRPL